jgi:hypothetical protein
MVQKLDQQWLYLLNLAINTIYIISTTNNLKLCHY